MKFGKSLNTQIKGTFPEWRDKFLSYKELKKKLKLIEPKCEGGGDNGGSLKKRRKLNDDDGVISDEEIDFVMLLEAEVEKFNGFFEEKEEEYIIRLKEFQDSVSEAKESSEELVRRIRKDIVDFHGDMVLLENYSAFNYTGLVKILKKYDKRTGALIRLPFIQKVLQQPFFTMDLLYKLIKECEIMIDVLFPICKPSVSRGDGDEGCNPINEDGLLEKPEQLIKMKYNESLYMKGAVSALRILKEIRSGSSTVSAFSLPPLQSPVLDEMSQIPVLEPVAK